MQLHTVAAQLESIFISEGLALLSSTKAPEKPEYLFFLRTSGLETFVYTD